jgi:multisubunit Na+/H+ antiporter MnhB subunit
MPYGYYQFVRFAAMVGFAYLAYSANEQNRKNNMFIYIALALLFQPFIKIALGRTIWNAVDVVVAIGLVLSMAFQSKTKLKH